MTPLKTKEAVILLVYFGISVSRVKAEDIPPEVDAAWRVAIILLGIEEKVVVFRPPEHSTRTERDKDLTW